MIFSSPSNAPPQMNRMLDVLLLRMLAPSLRRDRSHGAFQDLQQRLLDALARHVPRYARVLGLAGDLVYLVNVDDAALALGDVEITGLQQPHQDVLHVLAHVPGFGERRGVRDRERHVQDPGKRLRQQRLSDAGGPDEHDVALVQLDVILHRGRVDALVVVVHRHRERLLGLFLPDHVLVQDLLDLRRSGDLGDGLGNLALLVLRENLVAQRDALVADVDGGPGDELPDRILRLSAEGTAQVFVVGHGQVATDDTAMGRDATKLPSNKGRLPRGVNDLYRRLAIPWATGCLNCWLNNSLYPSLRRESVVRSRSSSCS
jgi:hypothetical protein